MSTPRIAPFGTWPSAIDAARVAAGVRPVSSPRFAGERLLWLEGLPDEGGRSAIVERGPDGRRRVRTAAPFNVRTRVHEYGGGAFAAVGDTVWFSNFADNLVHAQRGDAAPVAITAVSSQRHADFEPDLARGRLLAVREDHGGGPGVEAVATIVALPLDGGPSTTLVSGHDFYAAPRLSPEGRRLAWLAWRHPRMPWDGTELWVAAIGDDGTLLHPRCVAGGSGGPGAPDESLCQPQWSPDGFLHVVSDRSGFWNLHRLEKGGLVPILPMAAEFAKPMWQFAQSDYGFVGPRDIVASCRENGRGRLLRIDVDAGRATPIETGFEDFVELRVQGGTVLLDAGAPTRPQGIVALDLASGAQALLASSIDDVPPPGLVSVPHPISFPSADGRIAHAFHYAPRNDGFAAPAGERPPLIVIGHGGPTGIAVATLKLAIQFWTSRGFAVLDVNYGGSVGYGRAYRELLVGQWGIVDVEDCVAGARFLAEHGLADGARMAIRGGSAGGYTALSALAFHDVFKAGASYYGVADLRGIDEDSHKFESQYNTSLLGPLERREAVYRERSPLNHAHRIACPTIFFQGQDDKVVPPSQSERMVAALRERGIPVEYLAFEGEGHGFRKKETLQRSLEAELAFYARVFGFEAAAR